VLHVLNLQYTIFPLTLFGSKEPLAQNLPMYYNVNIRNFDQVLLKIKAIITSHFPCLKRLAPHPSH
jgi:hypothetical protein